MLPDPQGRALAATEKMGCRSPGVLRQGFEVSHRIDAEQGRIGSEGSIGNRAKRRAAMSAQHVGKLCGGTRERCDSFVRRVGTRTRHGVAFRRSG